MPAVKKKKIWILFFIFPTILFVVTYTTSHGGEKILISRVFCLLIIAHLGSTGSFTDVKGRVDF